ncbi:MAG: hypothetical protein EHM40_09235 [Chloroflexi bacterium]|nr:MAG: hypothetical protein EHM40_09235 [Chloroflexota bacterium]
MNRLSSKKFILGTIIFLMIIVVAIESQTKIIRRLYDDMVMDNKNHYLSCDQLPSVSEVTSIIEKHRDTIEQIEQINPDQAGVEMDSLSCPGKADIVIWYASHADRIKIEQLIDGETFFGAPFRLQNR